MRINRRGALGLLGLGGAGAAATSAQTATVKLAFGHGVASGDPLQDRVVLWTRLTPELNGWTGPITGKVVIVASPDLKGARAIPFSTSADRSCRAPSSISTVARDSGTSTSRLRSAKKASAVAGEARLGGWLRAAAVCFRSLSPACCLPVHVQVHRAAHHNKEHHPATIIAAGKPGP